MSARLTTESLALKSRKELPEIHDEANVSVSTCWPFALVRRCQLHGGVGSSWGDLKGQANTCDYTGNNTSEILLGQEERGPGRVTWAGAGERTRRAGAGDRDSPG